MKRYTLTLSPTTSITQDRVDDDAFNLWLYRDSDLLSVEPIDEPVLDPEPEE